MTTIAHLSRAQEHRERLAAAADLEKALDGVSGRSPAAAATSTRGHKTRELEHFTPALERFEICAGCADWRLFDATDAGWRCRLCSDPLHPAAAAPSRAKVIPTPAAALLPDPQDVQEIHVKTPTPQDSEPTQTPAEMFKAAIAHQVSQQLPAVLPGELAAALPAIVRAELAQIFGQLGAGAKPAPTSSPAKCPRGPHRGRCRQCPPKR